VDSHQVWRAGQAIELTATEFRLLGFLVAHARQVLSKAQILDAVWEDSFTGESNIVEIYISYLRKKIDRFDPPLIHTVRGVGYCVREPSR
jgi:two-component system, OmpR family, response regulator